MFKMILTARKRPELSREAFIDYYDNCHVPFMHRLLGGGGASVHRRNFVIRQAAGEEGGAFDVVTEVLYKDREAFEAAVRLYADPEILRQAREDEDRFIMPGSIRAFVVEPHETVFERVPETDVPARAS